MVKEAIYVMGLITILGVTISIFIALIINIIFISVKYFKNKNIKNEVLKGA